jgi:hypothetical protein
VSFGDDYGITDAFDILAGKCTRPELINPYLRWKYSKQKPRDGELWRNPMSRELVRYVEPKGVAVDNGQRYAKVTRAI